MQSAASLPTNAFRICEAYGGQHGRRALLKFVIPLPAAYPFFARVSLQHLLPWFWMTPKLFPPARKVHAAAARGCPRCRPSHRACRLVGNQARGRVVGRGARHPPASSSPGPSPYAQGVRLPPRTPFPAEKEVSAPRLPFSRGRPTATLPGGASSSTAFPPPIQSTPGRGGGEIDDGRSIAQPERRRDAVDRQTDRPAGRGGRVRSRCDGAPLLLRRPWRRASGCADVPARGVPGQEEYYRRRPVCPAHQ